LLIFGIISYGYMLSFRQGLSQGVGEGARAAAVTPENTSTSDRQIRAREAINAGIGNYNVACNASSELVRDGSVVGQCVVSAPQTCSASTINARCVKVTVTYNYKDYPLVPDVPGIGLVLPDTLTVVSESQVS
jgi:Flp pilus assembly protein TadG